MARRTADEARSLWKAFIADPKNAALRKRYAKSANEPAPLFEHIGEDLASSSPEVREQEFWALVLAIPELMSISHERQRDVDFRLANYSALLKELEFKLLDENRKDPRPVFYTIIYKFKKDNTRRQWREELLSFDESIELISEIINEENRWNVEEFDRLFAEAHKQGIATTIKGLYSPFAEKQEIQTSHGQALRVMSVYECLKTIMEREENEQQYIEGSKTEAFRNIESVEELLLSSALPDHDKADVFSKLAHVTFRAAEHHPKFKETLYQKVQALQQKGDIFVHKQQPEARKDIGQAPDLSKIARWQGRKQDGMPLDFIKAHYGQWLSAFDSQEDAIFQDQIRKHDPGLITAINNQLREEGQGRKIREFVKPRSARTDRELASITSDSLKHAESLSVSKRRRQAKARTTPKPSSE